MIEMAILGFTVGITIGLPAGAQYYRRRMLAAMAKWAKV